MALKSRFLKLFLRSVVNKTNIQFGRKYHRVQAVLLRPAESGEIKLKSTLTCSSESSRTREEWISRLGREEPSSVR